MSKRAWLYILGMIGAGTLLSAAAFLSGPVSAEHLAPLAVLAILATGAQMSKSLFRSKQQSESATTSYSPLLLFLFAGVLLLPPPLFVLLVLIPLLVDWLKERYLKTGNLPAWYIQPFNIATHIVCGLAAQQAYLLSAKYWLVGAVPAELTAGLIAMLIYAGMNHVVIGLVLVLARGVTWRESGVIEAENLLPDVIMMSLGFGAALLWQRNPWFILAAVSPLWLIQRALMVMQLKQEARVDSKTGLWNARHFAELFKAEFKRAKRFDRPLAVIMADLDLLRNVNNTYGHLAGDTVLGGIGEIIRQTVREYDIAARFGGEEFVIAIPEASPDAAAALAERIRKNVESAEFHARTTSTPIRVTLSQGIACFPLDALGETELIHAADVAVYQAKLLGRNRVVASSDVPRALDMESVASDRLTAPSIHEFAAMPEVLDSLRPPRAESAAAESVEPEVKKEERQVAPPLVGIAEPNEEHGRPGTATEVPPKAIPQPSRRARWLLNFYILVILGMGLALVLEAFPPRYPLDWAKISLLAALAFVGEMLQVDATDESTVSVSAAVNFAAALVGGLPALLFTSTAIAVAHRIKQRGPWGAALYRTAFNWAVHALAGLAPLVTVQLLNVPLDTPGLGWLLLPAAVASLVYFAVETSLLAVAIGLSTSEEPGKVWKENFRWLTGHYLVLCMIGALMAVAYLSLGILGIAVFAVPAVMMRYVFLQYVERTRAGMQEMKRMNRQLSQANGQVLQAIRSMRQLNEELFLTLAKIIDARDPYVAGHASKVKDYAVAIARHMGLPAEREEHVRQAALLHDIGKIGIPERILHKAERLTEEEYNFVKVHATLGGEFLETSQGLRHLATFVRHHHEWWDGSGYPDGWLREQIPLEARILAVCDAVEAMASDRPYHRAMSLPQIVSELKRCAGTQFDPEVVQSFVAIVEKEGPHLVVNSAREVVRQKAWRGEMRKQLAYWVVPEEFEATESGPVTPR